MKIRGRTVQIWLLLTRQDHADSWVLFSSRGQNCHFNFVIGKRKGGGVYDEKQNGLIMCALGFC